MDCGKAQRIQVYADRIVESVRAAIKLVYEYGKAIVTEESLFQLRSDLVVFREFKVSIEKSVEQGTF